MPHISSGKNYYRLLLLYFICYHVFVPQVICTYMAKQTLFKVELNSLEAFSVWDIIFPYWETLSENGSHRLTGAHNSSTLEAMNWRLYCIPRVGVHYLGAPCVRPAPIGTCPSGALMSRLESVTRPAPWLTWRWWRPSSSTPSGTRPHIAIDHHLAINTWSMGLVSTNSEALDFIKQGALDFIKPEALDWPKLGALDWPKLGL